MAIGGIGEEDFEEVKMEEGRRDDGKKNVAHPEEVQVAVEDQPCDTCIQNDRPRDGDGDIELSQVVKVHDRTPVTTFRADVPHFGEAAVVVPHGVQSSWSMEVVEGTLERGQVM